MPVATTHGRRTEAADANSGALVEASDPRVPRCGSRYPGRADPPDPPCLDKLWRSKLRKGPFRSARSRPIPGLST
jgi:hypothetical protein